jgi:hypothetical protein
MFFSVIDSCGSSFATGLSHRVNGPLVVSFSLRPEASYHHVILNGFFASGRAYVKNAK